VGYVPTGRGQQFCLKALAAAVSPVITRHSATGDHNPVTRNRYEIYSLLFEWAACFAGGKTDALRFQKPAGISSGMR